MEAKVSGVLRVGEWDGNREERRGKWRKIDSVLVGLSCRELEVSHWVYELDTGGKSVRGISRESMHLKYS